MFEDLGQVFIVLFQEIESGRIVEGNEDGVIGDADIAVDSPLGVAVIPYERGGIALLDLASGVFTDLLAAEQAIAAGAAIVDADQHRAYVLAGQALAEVDLEARQVTRWIPFAPPRDFHAGRMALAASCGKAYVACQTLAEVNLENGEWELIADVGQCPAAVAHVPGLGALYAARGEQLYSSYHRCDPGEGR